MTQSIRIMIIDDSALFRGWLIQSLSADPRFEVVGFAVNAMDAQTKIPLLKPDLLTLDIEMPGMSGIEFLKQFLPRHPIPVILVSSLNLRVFEALEAGAVDFVRKPDAQSGLSREIFLSTLKSKLAMAAKANVHLPSAPEREKKNRFRLCVLWESLLPFREGHCSQGAETVPLPSSPSALPPAAQRRSLRW